MRQETSVCASVVVIRRLSSRYGVGALINLLVWSLLGPFDKSLASFFEVLGASSLIAGVHVRIAGGAAASGSVLQTICCPSAFGLR